MKRFIETVILGRFFAIELTSIERQIALESVADKYAKALGRTVVCTILSLPAILFLDTSVIISVLIPITMVAGTAWFAISLANMKQKFESFGLELTADLFEAFSISLGLLLALSVFSLFGPFWHASIAGLPGQSTWQFMAALLGSGVIGNIVYRIFSGSVKYDINDAMLTGQNEAAERFYRKSLSLLHSVADSLREGKSTQVANYYIGVALFEVFSYIKSIGVMNGKLAGYMEESNRLVKQPSMDQDEADAITIKMVKTVIAYCTNPQGHESAKSLEAIHDELACLEQNTDEAQEMVDTRFAIIFQELASLLEGQGETLFKKPE